MYIVCIYTLYKIPTEGNKRRRAADTLSKVRLIIISYDKRLRRMREGILQIAIYRRGIRVLDFLPYRSTERPTRAKRIVYLRAHQNGYLVVTGRNSFTYGDFYDIRDEKEDEECARGEKENYSRPVLHSVTYGNRANLPTCPFVVVRSLSARYLSRWRGL